jgi:ABC-type glycerol-3-phosphate transport system substrate-binding protein
MSCFAMDAEGNLITLETVYHWDENSGSSSQEYYICRYDAQGQETSEKDITEEMLGDEEDIYVQSMTLDGEGRIYIACDSAIYLLDAEGNYCGSVDISGDAWINSMGVGKDGKVYAGVYEQGNGAVLREIDFDGRKEGESCSNFISNSGNRLTAGVDKDFMVNDGSSLYEYDCESQTLEKLFDWLDCDVNGNNVNALYAMEDGRILTVTYDWENNTAEAVLLTKTPAAEVQEKTTITIGTLYSNSDLQSAAVKFNKNNDTYHISMQSYYDYNAVTWDGENSNYQEVMQDAITRMNNDITSDNCPDLLVLNGVNVERLASKGLFEDLGTYLDNSTVLNRSDYFENILDSCTYDGVLVSIPKQFSLATLVGKASDLGTESGWTLEEMLAYGDAHPEAELFANCTKENALEIMLSYNQSSYVDWETGKCSFDSDSFTNILELASRFPDEVNYDDDQPSEPVRIAAGEVLLNLEYIYDFQSIQLAQAIFQQDVNFIGYPNDKGESGTYLSVDTGLAITSKSANKEGAWAFLEDYLNAESKYSDWGFSSRKDLFAAAREEATKVEYVLDEDGNQMLDEDGNPIVSGSGGGISYGDDWSYEYHTTTEEEADKLEELINSAAPAMDSDTEIMSIIKEEAQAFFEGQKSASDVAGIIQSRVQVYVNENS